MRIAFGLSSLRFFQHDSRAEADTFVRDASEHVWLGTRADAYSAFWSAEVSREFGGIVARIGITMDSVHAMPQVAVSSAGTFLAIGFNNNVVFLQFSPLRHVERLLGASFYCFIALERALIAVHELGCTSFCLSTFDTNWTVCTGILIDAVLNGTVLELLDDDGNDYRIDAQSGRRL